MERIPKALLLANIGCCADRVGMVIVLAMAVALRMIDWGIDQMVPARMVRMAFVFRGRFPDVLGGQNKVLHNSGSKLNYIHNV